MEKETFVGVADRYNGITVDSKEESCSLEGFPTKLLDSLEKWRGDDRRCIWFKVNIKDAGLVPLLASEGFNFHHSKDNFVMMYKWLPTDCASNLPPCSHTNLGVGGMVFNDKNQLLVVTEKYHDSYWKLPGGYVERGEDIKDAAIREVKEETGIDATFESMVTMRHMHRMMFDNSDIYAIVRLRATSHHIQKSDTEIKECQWMDVEEFLNHPRVNQGNKDIVQQAYNLEERKVKLNLAKNNNSVRPCTLLVLENL